MSLAGYRGGWPRAPLAAGVRVASQESSVLAEWSEDAPHVLKV